MAEKGKGSLLDKYPQKYASSYVVVAAHNSGPFGNQIPTNWQPKDKVGLIIERTKWFIGPDKVNLDAVGDQAHFGISIRDLTNYIGMDHTTPGVVEYNNITTQYGTLVGLTDVKNSTIVNEYTNLIGGGLIVHPANLWAFSENHSAAAWASTLTINLEIWYHFVDLSPEDWQEMWQLGYIVTTL